MSEGPSNAAPPPGRPGAGTIRMLAVVLLVLAGVLAVCAVLCFGGVAFDAVLLGVGLMCGALAFYAMILGGTALQLSSRRGNLVRARGLAQSFSLLALVTSLPCAVLFVVLAILMHGSASIWGSVAVAAVGAGIYLLGRGVLAADKRAGGAATPR